MSADDLTNLAQNVARSAEWPVFPLAADKRPAISKKEGGAGFHDASLDPETIRRLFNHRRAELIGIPTGQASGLDVLDIDTKHDAARAWLIAARPRLPATRIYQTRSGGFHLLFRHAPGVRNSESVIARGVDTRGDGGYFALWFGAGYPCLDHSQPSDWPEWLLETLFYEPPAAPVQQRKKVAAFVDDGGSAGRIMAAALRELSRAAEGSRHSTLRAAACTLGGVIDALHMSRSRAEELLLDAVLTAGGVRVDQENATATIAWGLEKGSRDPLIGRGAA